jgi:hypothetical protein
MSTILDDAEARIAPATERARATRAEIIERMREEIGRQHYEQAKVELSKVERVIAQEVRPYLNRLTRLSQHATAPLRSDILKYVRELETACATGTDWVRAGIDEWNSLAPPFVKGTLQLDLTRRAEEVGSIRMKLKSWDGRESRMRDLVAYINQYIQESGWPAM